MNSPFVIGTLVKINLQQELAYRTDALVNILVNLMWLGWELLSLSIIFSNTTSLGGWGFGISRYCRNPALAAQFIREAVSLEAQRALCLTSGYAPARLEAYGDPQLLASNVLLPEILRLHRDAAMRPAIPRYALASDILQRHVSACLAGLVTSQHALTAAAKETRLLLGRPR